MDGEVVIRGVQANGCDRPGAPRPRDDGGGLLHLARLTHDRDGRAAEHGARLEDGIQRSSNVLEGAGVGRGDEDGDEVGCLPHRVEQVTGHLADGVGGDGVLGEGGGEPARHVRRVAAA
jgi:hypothetical protein